MVSRWIGLGLGIGLSCITSVFAEDGAPDRVFTNQPGLDVELVVTGEYFENLSGGVDEGGAYRGDYSLFVTLDTEEAGWWDNGTVHVHLQAQHGDSITDDHVGDAQVLSNIDADDYAQVSEFYYEHRFDEGRHRLKLGKLEANADFAATDFGAGFINSSPGFSPTIPLTTYPDQDWGAMLAIGWTTLLSTRIGIYQGRPNGGQSIGNTIDNLYGPLAMVETAWEYSTEEHPGTVRLGAWWNGDRFEDLDRPGTFENAAGGIYATWDQIVFESNDGDEAIGVFGQLGASESDTIEIDRYVGGGVEWRGAIQGRSDDALGVGVFHARFADALDSQHSAETVLEVYYAFQATARLLLKPDVQIVWHPGGTDLDTAIVTGLRAELVF